MNAIKFALLALISLVAHPLRGNTSWLQVPNEAPQVEPLQTEPTAPPVVEGSEDQPTNSTDPSTSVDSNGGSAPSSDASKNPTNEGDALESGDDQKGISDAERIAELNDSIDGDQKQIKALEVELENPQSEYAMAEREFRELDNKLDAAKEQLDKALADSTLTAEQRSDLESEIETISKLWKLAKDRFDLAIEDRKTLKEQLYTLKHKLERDQAALKVITDGPEPERNADEGDSRNDEHSDHHRSSKRNDSQSDRDRNSSDQESDENSQRSGDSMSSDEADEETDEELKKAREVAEQKEAEAEEAQEETRSIEARLKDLQLLIAQEQKELNIAKKKVDLATATGQELSAELTKVQSEDPSSDEIATLKTAISSASQRLIQARSEVNEINERLNDHRAELSTLQSEHIIALHEAEKKRREAQESEQYVSDLKNPYTVRNILQWLLEHGPRLALIFLGMFIVNRTASILANRSVQFVSKGSMRGSKAERENRAKTLVGVFQNAASVGIFITGCSKINTCSTTPFELEALPGKSNASHCA